MPSDTMVTVAEAADLLHVNVRTIHRLIARGDLRGRKAFDGLRAPFLLDRADLDALIERRRSA